MSDDEDVGYVPQPKIKKAKSTSSKKKKRSPSSSPPRKATATNKEKKRSTSEGKKKSSNNKPTPEAAATASVSTSAASLTTTTTAASAPTVDKVQVAAWVPSSPPFSPPRSPTLDDDNDHVMTAVSVVSSAKGSSSNNGSSGFTPLLSVPDRRKEEDDRKFQEDFGATLRRQSHIHPDRIAMIQSSNNHGTSVPSRGLQGNGLPVASLYRTPTRPFDGVSGYSQVPAHVTPAAAVSNASAPMETSSFSKTSRGASVVSAEPFAPSSSGVQWHCHSCKRYKDKASCYLLGCRHSICTDCEPYITHADWNERSLYCRAVDARCQARISSRTCALRVPDKRRDGPSSNSSSTTSGDRRRHDYSDRSSHSSRNERNDRDRDRRGSRDRDRSRERDRNRDRDRDHDQGGRFHSRSSSPARTETRTAVALSPSVASQVTLQPQPQGQQSLQFPGLTRSIPPTSNKRSDWTCPIPSCKLTLQSETDLWKHLEDGALHVSMRFLALQQQQQQQQLQHHQHQVYQMYPGAPYSGIGAGMGTGGSLPATLRAPVVVPAAAAPDGFVYQPYQVPQQQQQQQAQQQVVAGPGPSFLPASAQIPPPMGATEAIQELGKYLQHQQQQQQQQAGTTSMQLSPVGASSDTKHWDNLLQSTAGFTTQAPKLL
jgi:hypothetical protein